MKSLFIFFSLIASFSCFPYILVVNTYNSTCFVPFENVFSHVEVEEDLSFFSGVAYVYKPPDIKGKVSIKFPEEKLIVLENGRTIGVLEGDIKVPKEFFEKLVRDFEAGIFKGVRIDRFPIEIYSIEKIHVEEPVNRNKFMEFLSYFFKKFEMPKEWIVYGDINAKPQKPVLAVYPVTFPDFGTVVFVKVEDNYRYSILWEFDGRKGKNIPIVLEKSGTLKINVKNELGLASSQTVYVEPLKFRREHYELIWELGKKLILPEMTWFSSLERMENHELVPRIPGVMNLFGFKDDNMIHMVVRVVDRTPPELELMNGKITVHDMTAVNLTIVCDGKPIKGFIPPGRHVVYVKAVDTYGNSSEKIFLVKNPYVTKMGKKPKVVYLGKEKKIEICGITLSGHILYGWSSQRLRGQVDGVDLEIEIER